MDNHAGNFNVNCLKWLGGMIDSDGCVSISKSRRRNNKMVYIPSIIITNKNIVIIEFIHELLNYYKINHHIKPNGSCKNIVISRPTIIHDFVKLIYDFILVKRTEIRLIHQFCLNRINNVETAGCNWKALYTEKEIKIADELSYLNRNHYKECVEYRISESIVDHDVMKLFSLHWLAGFIDGDGCITINKIIRPNGSYQYQPCVSIVTGSPLAKGILVNYLDMYNVDYYLKKQLPGVRHKPNCKNKKFEFSMRSLSECIKISSLIKDKLHGKKERCLMFIEFCNSRIQNKNKKYTDHELGLYKKIKENIKDPSTTKSKTSIDEDIV